MRRGLLLELDLEHYDFSPESKSLIRPTEGTIVANLGYDKVLHPHPVFHGDTVYAESEIIEMRESKSRPNEIGRASCRERV